MKKIILISLTIVVLATLVTAIVLLHEKRTSNLSRGRAYYFKDGVVVVDEINRPMSFYVIKCDPDQIESIKLDAYNIHVDLKLVKKRKRGFSAGTEPKRISILRVESLDISASYSFKSPQLIETRLAKDTRTQLIVGLIDELER